MNLHDVLFFYMFKICITGQTLDKKGYGPLKYREKKSYSRKRENPLLQNGTGSQNQNRPRSLYLNVRSPRIELQMAISTP